MSKKTINARGWNSPENPEVVYRIVVKFNSFSSFSDVEWYVFDSAEIEVLSWHTENTSWYVEWWSETRDAVIEISDALYTKLLNMQISNGYSGPYRVDSVA